MLSSPASTRTIGELCGPLVTTLHDKRRSPAFQGNPVRRFPHHESLLSMQCKYGVLGSRLIHFSRIITDPQNFVDEVVGLMVEMVRGGYSLNKLLSHCRGVSMRVAVDLGLAPGVLPLQGGRVSQGLRKGLYSAIRVAVVRQLRVG